MGEGQAPLYRRGWAVARTAAYDQSPALNLVSLFPVAGLGQMGSCAYIGEESDVGKHSTVGAPCVGSLNNLPARAGPANQAHLVKLAGLDTVRAGEV
jgi:hypothetical protein